MKTLIASRENESNITQVKIENDGVQTPRKRVAARESGILNKSLLLPGGFLDSQTGDTQFFEFTQYRSPYFQESQTEDGECEIYSSSPWRPTQNVKEESASPSLTGSPPRKKARNDSPDSTTSITSGARPEAAKGLDKSRELKRARDVQVGLLHEEQRIAEQEIERKAKDVLQRLKSATEELRSLETDAMIERDVLNAAEAQAATARQKITQLELCSQSVRKEILDFEGNLAVLMMTRFGQRLQPTFGPFVNQSVREGEGEEDPPHPSVYTQIDNAINEGYSPPSIFRKS